MLETKIIKGKILIIRLGMIIPVKNKGKNMLTFKFLKNSISSKRFNKIPKQ
jgi:hypothetical protein